MKSRSNLKKWILWGLLGIVAVAGGGFALRLALTWKAPLGPDMGLPTRPPGQSFAGGFAAGAPPERETPGASELSTPEASSSSETPAPAENDASATSQPGELEVENPQPAAVPTGEPLCGGPPEMLVLAVAADSDDEEYLYGLADAIRLVYVDFVTPKVVILSMPRDLWVEIPGIEQNYGITHGKLNQSYLYGNPGLGYYTGPGAGPGLLSRTLAYNFGVYPNHYGALNMRTFVEIVDAVGGIDLYLDAPLDGNDKELGDYGFFPAGQNHLDGDRALNYSRIRNVGGTTGRTDRQTEVLLALRDKVLSSQGVISIPEMINAFIGRVQTDLSLDEVSQLTCLGTQIDRSKIYFTRIPDELLDEGRTYSEQLKGMTFIYSGDFQVIAQYIQDAFYRTEETLE